MKKILNIKKKFNLLLLYQQSQTKNFLQLSHLVYHRHELTKAPKWYYNA